MIYKYDELVTKVQKEISDNWQEFKVVSLKITPTTRMMCNVNVVLKRWANDKVSVILQGTDVSDLSEVRPLILLSEKDKYDVSWVCQDRNLNSMFGARLSGYITEISHKPLNNKPGTKKKDVEEQPVEEHLVEEQPVETVAPTTSYVGTGNLA